MSEHDAGAQVPPEAPAGDSQTPPTVGTPGTGQGPDALGEVTEHELVPESESSIPAPGEALEELLPALETTGHAGVDDALATLDDLAGSSVHEHVEVFDAVHQELRRTLDRAADDIS